MRLSTRTHGYIDLALAVALLASSWLLGVPFASAAALVPAAAGIAIIGNALVTDFELGRSRTLQIPVHLWIDAAVGVLLGLSPWLFLFYDVVWLPHVLAGMVLIVVAALTRTVPGYDRRGAVG